MTDDLLCRCLVQAIDYGELMLTIEEFGAYWQWTQLHPGAAFAIGPGRIVALDRLHVRVLAEP